MSACKHGAHVHRVRPGTDGCADCLKTGGRWVHLRLCMECGHVGCCDDSPNKHATKHAHATHHPIIKSFEVGEEWGWCYIDEATLDAQEWQIDGPRHHSPAADRHLVE